MVTHDWWGNKFCKRTAKTHTSANLRSAEIRSAAGTAFLRGGELSRAAPCRQTKTRTRARRVKTCGHDGENIIEYLPARSTSPWRWRPTKQRTNAGRGRRSPYAKVLASSKIVAARELLCGGRQRSPGRALASHISGGQPAVRVRSECTHWDYRGRTNRPHARSRYRDPLALRAPMAS
jgi:hypothetical protein